MATAPVRIERQADGRHAVMDATGKLLGLHKSPWSAARQMHDYYGAAPMDDSKLAQAAVAPSAPAPEKMVAPNDVKPGAGGEHPPVPHPARDNPPPDAIKITVKRIPRP
jgi:hypothetical protein